MFIPESKSLITFKAGKWTFTAECDSAEIYPLLVRAHTMFEAVSSIPVLPQWQSRLKTELISRSIFGTAALEGNPMTQAEVRSEVRGETSPSPDLPDAKREIVNLKRLYDHLKNIRRPQAPLSEKLVRKFHAIIADGLAFEDNIPGQYRASVVQVGDAAHGGVYTPPKERADVMKLMEAFFSWFNDEQTQEMDPLLRAACAHYYLVRIHPFRDGNGRTARFAEAYVLATSGLQLAAPMLSNYYYRFKDDYFRVISETAKKGDMTPFFRFFLTAFYEELKIIRDEIIPFINTLLMKDVIAFFRESKQITQRQMALLSVMLDHDMEIEFDDLYRDPALMGYYMKVSKSTARRDLKKLTDMKLLSMEDKKYRVSLAYLRI